MARRIQKKEGAQSSSHPCLSKFLAYRRCVSQFTNNYLSKCAIPAGRYRECLDTTTWQPAVSASYVKMLHALGIFSTKKKSSISNLGAGSVIRF